MQAQRQVAPRRPALQKDPMTVMVLKATDPIEYGSPGQRKTKVFLATVATSNQVFQVKVLNFKLKKAFKEKNVIILSQYIRYKNVLEINQRSSVLKAPENQTIEVPERIWIRVQNPPKIIDLRQENSDNLPTIVSGLFRLKKKKDRKKTTAYVIEDDTGTMEVVGSEICYGIRCEEGDILRLFCFYLKKIKEDLKLISGKYSVLEVFNTNNQEQPSSLTIKLQFEMNSPLNPRGINCTIKMENTAEE
ncbi:myeloid cell nuclear differentiation antigen [Crocuta crocuta]